MLNVFIGYDPHEPIAYHVCANSIIRNCSEPVTISPLALPNLKKLYSETHKGRDGYPPSNAFIFSRFLVPQLCDFNGLALFVDGDMLVTEGSDIADLFNNFDRTKAVEVVKHEYKTKFPTKYLGAKNEDYPRKNWSSVIMFNCGHYQNKKLTADYVSNADGGHLHRFEWLDDDRIGDLPEEWNWLTEEYEHNDNAKLLHYTIGTPCFKDFIHKDHSKEWWSEYAQVIYPVEPQERKAYI